MPYVRRAGAPGSCPSARSCGSVPPCSATCWSRGRLGLRRRSWRSSALGRVRMRADWPWQDADRDLVGRHARRGHAGRGLRAARPDPSRGAAAAGGVRRGRRHAADAGADAAVAGASARPARTRPAEDALQAALAVRGRAGRAGAGSRRCVAGGRPERVIAQLRARAARRADAAWERLGPVARRGARRRAATYRRLRLEMLPPSGRRAGPRPRRGHASTTRCCAASLTHARRRGVAARPRRTRRTRGAVEDAAAAGRTGPALRAPAGRAAAATCRQHPDGLRGVPARRHDAGCTCACAWPAGTWAAATPRPRQHARRALRRDRAPGHAQLSSPARPGAGASSTSSSADAERGGPPPAGRCQVRRFGGCDTSWALSWSAGSLGRDHPHAASGCRTALPAGSVQSQDERGAAVTRPERDRPWVMRTYAGHSTAASVQRALPAQPGQGPDRVCRSRSTCPPRPATTPTTRSPAARSARSACRWRTWVTCGALFDGIPLADDEHLDDDQRHRDVAAGALPGRRRGAGGATRPRPCEPAGHDAERHHQGVPLPRGPTSSRPRPACG